jgi:uncharacterized protein (DUF1697 family)
MPRYAAFLRGINVGGHRVSSADLRSCVAELGFEDVAIFRASGNVVLSDEHGGGPGAVAARLEVGLAKSLGYDVPVFLRTASELQAIAVQDPFPARLVRGSAGKLQVLLLAGKPSAQTRQKVLALASDDDRLAIDGRELYWLPSGGISDSDLDLKAIESMLGKTTTRTKGTVEQIAAKHFGS